MFKAWVQNEYGDTIKEIDDCMSISVYSEEQMEMQFPEIIDAIGISSNYVCLVDSAGRHFYPLYICSVNIG